MNLNKSELKSSLLPYSEVVECKMHCIEQVDCFVLPSSPLPSHPYQGCIYTNGSIVCVMCMLTVAHGNVSGSNLLQKKKDGGLWASWLSFWQCKCGFVLLTLSCLPRWFLFQIHFKDIPWFQSMTRSISGSQSLIWKYNSAHHFSRVTGLVPNVNCLSRVPWRCPPYCLPRQTKRKQFGQVDKIWAAREAPSGKFCRCSCFFWIQ